MMKHFLLTACALTLGYAGAVAQTVVKNDGAMIVVEPGATVFIQGGLENVNGGTIDNDGTIEVQGNFLNSAIFDGADPNLVIFSGGANSSVTSGGAVFDDVDIDKDSGFNVNLMDDMTVGGTMTFASDNNKVVVGANDLIIQDNGTIAGADEDDYVVTGDVGFVVKEDLGPSETFTFPVGFDNTTYNPATIAATGSHTNDDISVRVTEHLYLDGSAEMEQATEGAVDAMWYVEEGTPGGYNADVTLGWAGTDQLTNFPTEVGVSVHDGTNWDLLASQVGAPTGMDPYTKARTGITSTGVYAVGGEPVGHQLGLDIQVLLSGPFDGVNRMNDNLRTGGYIPTTEPYTGLGYTHVGFGGGSTADPGDFDQPADDDDIVDWIVVELRESGTPTNVVATKEALLQRDGDVVAKDGSGQFFISGVDDGNYHVAIRHRNHLGIMTDGVLALSETPAVVDFKNGTTPEFDLGLFNGTDYSGLAQKDLAGGTYRGMWAGDASGDNKTKYQGGSNDPSVILAQVLAHPGNLSGVYNFNSGFGYYTGDIDLDGKVKYQGGSNDKSIVLANVLGFPANTSGTYNYNNMIAQLPQ